MTLGSRVFETQHQLQGLQVANPRSPLRFRFANPKNMLRVLGLGLVGHGACYVNIMFKASAFLQHHFGGQTLLTEPHLQDVWFDPGSRLGPRVRYLHSTLAAFRLAITTSPLGSGLANLALHLGAGVRK